MGALIGRHLRLVNMCQPDVLTYIIQRLHRAHGISCKAGRAESGGFLFCRDFHRDADQIGLELHHKSIIHHAAIDTHETAVTVGLAAHGVVAICHLEGDAFQHGAYHMLPRGAAGESDQHTAGILVPVGGCQTGKGGHEVYAVAVGYRQCHLFRLAGTVDDTDAVFQPFHSGACDVRRAIQAVGGLSVQAPHAAGKESLIG